jgi:drug/metabolite transporter (DMT)-like permease
LTASDLAESQRLRRHGVGVALAAAGAVAFSGKAIIVKLAYRYQVDAVTLIMWRMLLALPLFLIIAWWGGRGREPMTGRDLRVVCALGFCGYYLSSFLDFLGLQYVSASLERLILYLNPTLVLLLGWFITGRPVLAKQLWAMAVSYAGVLVVFGHEVQWAGWSVLPGVGLIFISAITYALYLVFSGEEVRRLGPLRLTGWASAWASVFCIAQFLLLRPLTSAWEVDPAVIQLSVINALACTVLPILLVMFAIERIGAAASAQAGMVGPLSTVVLGVWILNEPFTPWVVLGAALVLWGVWLLARAR